MRRGPSSRRLPGELQPWSVSRWETIGQTFAIGPIFSAGFYVLLTYAGAIGFGRAALAHNAWFASGNPFGELGQRHIGHVVLAIGWAVAVRIWRPGTVRAAARHAEMSARLADAADAVADPVASRS